MCERTSVHDLISITRSNGKSASHRNTPEKYDILPRESHSLALEY